MKLPFAERLGMVTTFYVPVQKLDLSIDYPQFGPTPARQVLHAFFLTRHSAYTHERSYIQGWWRGDAGVGFDRDDHERFEVAVRGRQGLVELSRFLAVFCGLVGEQAIYLTVGGNAFLSRPSGGAVKAPLLRWPTEAGPPTDPPCGVALASLHPPGWIVSGAHATREAALTAVTCSGVAGKPVLLPPPGWRLATVTEGLWVGWDVVLTAWSDRMAVCELPDGRGFVGVSRSHLRLWKSVESVTG